MEADRPEGGPRSGSDGRRVGLGTCSRYHVRKEREIGRIIVVLLEPHKHIYRSTMINLSTKEDRTNFSPSHIS